MKFICCCFFLPKLAYCQVGLCEESKRICRFIAPDGRLMQYNRLPFGIVSSPAYYMRVINQNLAPVRRKHNGSNGTARIFLYIDDLTIMSDTPRAGAEALNDVLVAFKEAGVSISPQKCSLFTDEFDLLGCKIIAGVGYSPSDATISKLENLEIPSSISGLRRMIGIIIIQVYNLTTKFNKL